MKAQSDAYGVQQQRAKERAREDFAGRAAASGQSSDLAGSGALSSGIAGLEQQQGEAQGAYNAGLLGSRAQQDRDELQQYMALAGGDLNAADARALTERMHALDAQNEREKITSGEKLGSSD